MLTITYYKKAIAEQTAEAQAKSARLALRRKYGVTQMRRVVAMLFDELVAARKTATDNAAERVQC